MLSHDWLEFAPNLGASDPSRQALALGRPGELGQGHAFEDTFVSHPHRRIASHRLRRDTDDIAEHPRPFFRRDEGDDIGRSAGEAGVVDLVEDRLWIAPVGTGTSLT